MAGDEKLEGGEATGKVPAAQPFSEPATVAGAKCAGIIAGAADLRSKLANFGKEISETPAPAKEAADVAAVKDPAEAPAPEVPAAVVTNPAGPDKAKEASEYVPGDYLLKVAFALMENSDGQALVLRTLSELRGQDEAQALVKAAADEAGTFLRDYTIARLQEADREAEQLKMAAAQQQLANYYAELTKGATAEQLQAIEDTAMRYKLASEPFTENPVAMQLMEFGADAAQKVAAAIEQGMSPEEAAMMAGAGGAPAEGPPSPEELEAALSTLVEQGIITPEEAQQLMAEILGGGAGAEQGMPPEMEQKQAAIREELSKIATEVVS